MSPRDTTISVIIPTLNEEEHLPALLRLLMKRQPHEIIVADGGSSDGTENVCREYEGVRFIPATNGRGHQMNEGASHATGDVLFFVHADSSLPDKWEYEITNLLNDHLAGTFWLKFDDSSFLLDFYSKCSSLKHWLFTYGDQGLFIKKQDFIEIGGYNEPMFLEDIDLLRRLYRKGSVVKSSLPITTSARRFRKKGVMRQQLRNIGILAGYLAGISPERLARFYDYS